MAVKKRDIRDIDCYDKRQDQPDITGYYTIGWTLIYELGKIFFDWVLYDAQLADYTRENLAIAPLTVYMILPIVKEVI